MDNKSQKFLFLWMKLNCVYLKEIRIIIIILITEHQVPGLLCHLKKLSWQQSYQCEDDIEDYPITENFKEKSREGRSKKYYRDYVVLQYVKRIVKKMEWVFRYTATRGSLETNTRGHVVTSAPATTAPRRSNCEHEHRRRHRRAQHGRRHRQRH